MGWESLIKHANLCFVFKIQSNAAPPPFNKFIMQRSNTQGTRGMTRGDLLFQIIKVLLVSPLSL